MNPRKQARDERLTSDVFALPGCVGTGARNTVADLLRLLGDEPGDLRAAESTPVLMRQLHTGHTLFHEGARAESIYVVCTGHFKSQRIAEDGAEHVLGFAGRAELLGFDALCIGAHPTSAVALDDATVYAVPVRDLSALGQRIGGFDLALHFALSRQLSRRDEQIALMAPMAAEVRMARFLMQQSLHMAARGQSPRLFHLPMGRRDIARYLGIAHEIAAGVRARRKPRHRHPRHGSPRGPGVQHLPAGRHARSNSAPEAPSGGTRGDRPHPRWGRSTAALRCVRAPGCRIAPDGGGLHRHTDRLGCATVASATAVLLPSH